MTPHLMNLLDAIGSLSGQTTLSQAAMKLKRILKIVSATSVDERRPFSAADKVVAQEFLRMSTDAPRFAQDLFARGLEIYETLQAGATDPTFAPLAERADARVKKIQQVARDLLREYRAKTNTSYKRGHLEVFEGSLP